MSEKIQDVHRDREAWVYVRQSTPDQVRHHHESQRLQYELASRARALGFRKVQVVDEDLGRSGSGSQPRPGFGRLLAAVCEARVGAVFALEASRLARNNRDWHHLIDLCAMTDTLVVDHDGVYDPRMLNDRLLLGLKGTMSEFELGLLRQRAQGALRGLVQRGVVIFQVPIGYERTRDRRCEMSPDLQVQQSVRTLFAKFAEFGSARQVLIWFREEGLVFPTWTPGDASVVRWKMPTYPRVLAVLQNPVYAGAFVYGRTRTRTVVEDGRARRIAGQRLPREAWEVLIQDHHPRYISWEQYLRNQQQLAANAVKEADMGSAAPKTGAAVLAGLLRCARCGRKLHVAYSGVGGRVPRYHCRGGNVNHGVAPCISFGGLRVDRAVSQVALSVLEPAGVEASLRAAEDVARADEDRRRALELALERARYEADRARRQYHAVEPENRLVAAELERRWESALAEAAQQEQRLGELRAAHEPVGPEVRDEIASLGADLERLWTHPSTPAALKKRVLRTLLVEIVADVVDDPPIVRLRLHWAGGVHTELAVARNRKGHHGRRTDTDVVELVRELARVCDDGDIARILNRLGLRTGTGNGWTCARVCSLRSYREIPVFDVLAERNWLNLAETARECGVSPPAVRKLIEERLLSARQIVQHAPWIIERADLARPAVQAALAAIKAGRRGPHSGRESPELLFDQAQ